jgi:tetratricopeptide (TPR) repeat protein
VTDRPLQEFQLVNEWLATEESAGRQYGPLLLGMATGRWRSEMSRDENLRRYGTLRFLLGVIRSDLFQYPLQARERAAVVIEYTEEVDVPSEQCFYFLGGLAWKEYANALRYTGEFPLALDAARKSRAIFEMAGSLACDAAKAYLVEALVHREFGDLDTVLAITAQCEGVFRDFEDAEAYMHARMTRALVLSDTKRFKEAMEVLLETARDAERRGDKRTLALCLHNSADCARALGDRQTARNLDARALVHFEELGTTVAQPTIRWNEAKALADEGRVSAAILQLYVSRSEFLALGMNGSAADCSLDAVRLRFDRGEDVTADCTELVETLTRAGMIQPAIEALAYLREQARSGAVSNQKITSVQVFVREAVNGQARMFLPPPEREA